MCLLYKWLARVTAAINQGGRVTQLGPLLHTATAFGSSTTGVAR